MKKNCSTRSAFFIPRILIGFALSLISVAIALFALGLTPLNNAKTDTPGWFHQLASALGVHLDSQKLASLSKPTRGGAGVPLSKIPGEPLQGIQDQTPTNYTGPRKDLRPVKSVYTRPLRDLPKIPPAIAVRREVREPARPKPPTDKPTGGFVQTLLGPVVSAPTPTDLSWDGVGVGLAGFVPSSNPPDTNGRVGAKQYVQWNNTSFAVFDKTTGALLFGPAAGNTLFQSLGGDCATHNDGDPVVSFDILAGRWVLSQFVVGASPDFSHQCVAVSQTEDATGAYYLYDFVTDSQNFVDYPKTAVWPDGYYMSGHVFNASGTAFLAGRIFVFEREKMLKGLPARQLQADLRRYANKPQFGFLPSDLDSLTPPPAGEAAFVIGPHPTSVNRLTSARVAVTWGGAPRIRLTESLIAETWGLPPCVNDSDAGDHRDCVPQPAPATPTDYLDNLDFRLMYRLAYRNFGGTPLQESLVGNVTVNGAAGRPPAHGAIRWYEFRNAGSSTTTPTVFQASTYDPDSAYRWMGSIAMDKDHNIALGYSKSSLIVIPSIFITGRLSTDPINTLGSEIEVQAGTGVQKVTNGTNPGNRWGDYSAMDVDPVDQCTFYYTNEYLKTDGAFNWSTRIASFRFPSCTSAPAWGTLTGTITSSPSGTPLSGVLVTLSNGYAGATNASGVYSFLVPPGTYTAMAADADRNCTSASPSSPTVVITSGGTTNQNFTMAGTSNLQENGVTIDDTTSGGNGNGVINRNECVNLNVELKNNGCADATGISATLMTTTPGVTIVQGSSNYPDMPIDATGTNSTPFQIQTAANFGCGTEIEFDLNLTFPNGSKTIHITVPTCTGGANQTFGPEVLNANDPTQADRLGRDGQPSGCSGKPCPGGGFPGTKRFQQFEFDNNSAADACYTVTINATIPGPAGADIESAAYLSTYDPTNLCLNYLGDSGIVGLGTTVGSASYSFTVPAQAHFVVVVNTTGTVTTSSEFSGIVSGFVDDNAGPGPCSASRPRR
jgi:Carboxypeptidase regulatory-like domain